MENKNTKPSVFPTREQMDAANADKAKLEAYENEKLKVTADIYLQGNDASEVPSGQIDAAEMMKRRTFNQLQSMKENGVVVELELAERPLTKNEELIRLRDAQLQKNLEDIQTYQDRTAEATNRHTQPVNNTNVNNFSQYNHINDISGNYTPPNNINNNGMNNLPPTNNQNNHFNDSYGENPSNINPYILELSQPNYNAPFDVIPLPSKGKLYRGKKQNVKLAYMTTSDENILTSPNLLQSGEFLEILINRKILDSDLRYKDLLPGDKYAIMIWLRATGYGEMYPITMLDETGTAFDAEINLNDLKTKELEVDPDSDGLFTFELPLSKAIVRFKMLTCGDIDKIEKMIENDKESNALLNNSSTYRLEAMIVEVNGSRDRHSIRDFIGSMRIGDAKKFNAYVDTLDSGIDLNITVPTPGGGSIATFLPFNYNFFWPDFGI